MTRLLLADDHPIILSGIESMLRGTRYEVAATAANGEAALAAIASARPDVLVLDLRMPLRSGLDVLRTIRGRGDDRIIVLLTADLDDGELVEAIQLGVNGIVLKESAQNLLLQCLDKVCAGGRCIEPSLLQRALDVTMEGSKTPVGAGAKLSARERAIIHLVAQGRRNRDIAAELGITEGTVKVYLHRLYQRLDVSNRTELALVARDMEPASQR